MAALHPPPTLRAVADFDVEAAHHRTHRGKVLLVLRRRAGHFDRAAAVRTPRWRRCRQGLVDLRRARAAPRPAIARAAAAARTTARTTAATLRLVLGERCGLPASRAARGSQLLFQVLVLALQPLDPTLQAVVLTMHALVARHLVTQSRDFPVLLLDDNVARVPLGRGLFQDGAYAAQRAHAPSLSAPRIKPFTPDTPILATLSLEYGGANPDQPRGAGRRYGTRKLSSSRGTMPKPPLGRGGCGRDGASVGRGFRRQAAVRVSRAHGRAVLLKVG